MLGSKEISHLVDVDMSPSDFCQNRGAFLTPKRSAALGIFGWKNSGASLPRHDRHTNNHRRRAGRVAVQPLSLGRLILCRLLFKLARVAVATANAIMNFDQRR